MIILQLVFAVCAQPIDWEAVIQKYADCESLKLTGTVVGIYHPQGKEVRITEANFSLDFVQDGKIGFRYEALQSKHTAIVNKDKNGTWDRKVLAQIVTHSMDHDAIELGDAVEGFPASIPLYFLTKSSKYHEFLSKTTPFGKPVREANFIRFESENDSKHVAIYVDSKTLLIEKIKTYLLSNPKDITITSFRVSKYRSKTSSIAASKSVTFAN